MPALINNSRTAEGTKNFNIILEFSIKFASRNIFFLKGVCIIFRKYSQFRFIVNNFKIYFFQNSVSKLLMQMKQKQTNKKQTTKTKTKNKKTKQNNDNKDMFLLNASFRLTYNYQRTTCTISP